MCQDGKIVSVNLAVSGGLILEYLRFSMQILQVRAVTVHATQNYFVTASADKTWNFYDLSTGICLTQVRSLLDSCGSL